MELNLEEALDAPVELSHRFDVPLGRLERPELLTLGAVELSGTLWRVEPGYSLDGQVTAEGTVACARCLVPVPFRATGDVSWVFEPASRQPGDEETELSAADLDVVYYQQPKVDLDPLVDEEIQLAIPMKPLCRPDCKGICPTCGADRNAGECGCRPEPDRRLAGLGALLPKER